MKLPHHARRRSSAARAHRPSRASNIGASALALALAAALLIAGCPTDSNPTRDLPPDIGELRPGENVLSSGAPGITVIEYGDFECPSCARFARETFPTIRREYVETGKVRWVYRHFPLRAVHASAEGAARAAQCAARQQQFWAFHDLLFENSPALSAADLQRYAEQFGLDTAAFAQCTADAAIAEQVAQDVALGQAAGVSGTPTFFVNGQRVVGFRTVEQFRALLDGALE